MAIDTRAKRASAGGVPYGWAGVSVTNDATPDQAWRQAVATSYTGILAAQLTQAATLGDLTTLWMDEYVEELKAANPTALDVDTLIRDDLATVRGTISDQDDLNTLYAIYLSST